MTNDKLFHKWVNNTISEDELKIFKLRPEYDGLVDLYRQTENLSGPDIDTEKMQVCLTCVCHKYCIMFTNACPHFRSYTFLIWIRYN